MNKICLPSFILIIPFFLSLSFTNDPLQDGLIAYYSFDNCTAKDDTNNGSDGVIYGKPDCVCGVQNEGFYFNGMRDYLEFEGPVNDYFTTSDLTISFYFKSDKYSLFQQSLLSKRSICDENNMLDIQLNLNQQLVDTDVYETPDRYFKDLSPNLEKTAWIHYALVRSGTKATTYINGHLRQISTKCQGVDIANDALLSFSNSPCLTGGRTVRFKGVLDELRIYDRAFTEAEILALYKRAPVETAEIDCVTFNEETLPNTPESDYICYSNY